MTLIRYTHVMLTPELDSAADLELHSSKSSWDLP